MRREKIGTQQQNMLQSFSVGIHTATGQSIIAKENLVTEQTNRSSKMTLLLLGTTDRQLAVLKERTDSWGKAARREIKRRKMVGFWDGTNATVVDSKEVIDATLDKKEEYVYAPGVRRTQLARRRNKHLQQWRKRMAWYHRVRKAEQAEEQEPALDFFDPAASEIVAKQSETTQYFEASLVEKLSKEVKK